MKRKKSVIDDMSLIDLDLKKLCVLEEMPSEYWKIYIQIQQVTLPMLTCIFRRCSE